MRGRRGPPRQASAASLAWGEAHPNLLRMRGAARASTSGERSKPRVGGGSSEFTSDEGAARASTSGERSKPRVGGGSSEFTSDEGGGACLHVRRAQQASRGGRLIRIYFG